jgi:hypothetical protein
MPALPHTSNGKIDYPALKAAVRRWRLAQLPRLIAPATPGAIMRREGIQEKQDKLTP